MIQVKGTFILLAQAYLSPKDDVNTISTSALKQYSKYIKASHEVMKYLSITPAKEKDHNHKIHHFIWLGLRQVQATAFQKASEDKTRTKPSPL